MASEPNLVLVGFMGTGKTTIGQMVADALDMPFVDTDAEIERQAGTSIARIFERGEDVFRTLEESVCRKAARRGGQVIATGGGALLNPAVARELAANGVIICLRADVNTIIARVGDDPTRPLAGDRAAMMRLLAERAPIYDQWQYQIDTTALIPEVAAREVIELWTQANI